MVLQTVGVAVPVGYLLPRLHHQSIGGHVTAATVMLALKAETRTGTGLGLLVAGAVVFAAGSVLLARPFVRTHRTLLVAVPTAAVTGMLVLGVIALLIGLTIAAGEWLEIFEGWDGPSGRSLRRDNEDDSDEISQRSWEP